MKVDILQNNLNDTDSSAYFKNNNFLIVKEAICKDLARFIFNYFCLKRQVAITLLNSQYFSPFEESFGIWNDRQAPNTYSHYADIVMETLLLKVKPLVEKVTGLELFENYSYARIYKKGDVLKRHKDRFSCEISTTLNLGGDEWPIYLEPDPTKGKEINNQYISENTSGIEVNLKPGDMLIYRGNLLEHWREKFNGEDCAQVFLHYNDVKTKGSDKNMFDTRPHLGLPAYFQKK